MKSTTMMAVTFSALVATATANPNELSFVNKIQNTPGIKWKAQVNEQYNEKAFKKLLGVKSSSRDAVMKLPNFVAANPTAEIPSDFDSEKNWPQCAKVIGDIRDQSNCGCCWAFGAASAASDRLCIATNGTTAVPLSAQDVCFCSSYDGCDGGQIDAPWEYIGETGVVTGGQYEGTYSIGSGGYCADFSLPHCHHHGPQRNDPYPAEGQPGCPSESSASCPTKCGSNSTSPNNSFGSDKWSFTGGVQSASGEEQIQRAIMEGGPVETAFTVYADFANYASGIYHHVSGSVMGGHAVRIVGWGEESGTKYWKVANSWNPYWGEDGYFRITRGTSECGIADGVTFSGSDAKWSKSS